MTVINLVDIKPSLAPDAVLEQAMGKFDSVIVLGWNSEGDLDMRASLNLSVVQVNYLLDMAKKKILRQDRDA